MARRKTKAKVVRPAEEVAADRTRVLRSAASIERSHWATGCAPGTCPTCSVPDAVGGRLDLSDRQLVERAGRFGVQVQPFAAGWRAAEKTSGVVVELHPELLEREEEDLDGWNTHPGSEEA